MWKATIRGLFARKVRLALTALAILLGVSFISATYVLTDTVKQSFDAVFAQTLSGVDLQVQGASALGDLSSPARIPDATIDEVRGVPGVRRAEGFLRTSLAQFVDRSGNAIGGGGPPTFGISWVHGGPLRLTGGRPPTGPREVAMDAGTASRHGFAVGDRVRILLSGAAKEYRIVGLFGFGDTTDFGAVTFAAFDLATAQREFGVGASIDAVYVQRDPDVPDARAPGPHLPGARARVRGAHRRRGHVADRQAGAAVPRLLHRRAARLRRDRRGRRCLHHLQHLHHPRGPAHPRARVAPRHGRDRWPGRAFGGAGGVRGRDGGLAARPGRGHRTRRGPPRAAAGSRARPSRHQPGRRVPHRHRVARGRRAGHGAGGGRSGVACGARASRGRDRRCSGAGRRRVRRAGDRRARRPRRRFPRPRVRVGPRARRHRAHRPGAGGRARRVRRCSSASC